MQTECRILSLLEYFAEVQPIFCKVSANREQYKKNHILFYILCENGAAGFVSIPFAANEGCPVQRVWQTTMLHHFSFKPKFKYAISKEYALFFYGDDLFVHQAFLYAVYI